MKHLSLKIKIALVLDLVFTLGISIGFYRIFILDNKDIYNVLLFIICTYFLSLIHSEYEFDNEIESIYNKISIYENLITTGDKPEVSLDKDKSIEIYNKITQNGYKYKFINSFFKKNPIEPWVFIPVICSIFSISKILLFVILIYTNIKTVIKIIRNYKESESMLIKIESILKKMEDFYNLKP